MSAVDLEKIRERHSCEITLVRRLNTCAFCVEPFPCDAIQLADEVERLRDGHSFIKKCNHANIREGLKTARENIRLRQALNEIRLNCADCKDIARAALREPNEQSERGDEDG